MAAAARSCARSQRKVRIWMLRHVVLARWFDIAILVVIAANCVLMAFDEPLAGPTPSQRLFDVLDLVGVPPNDFIIESCQLMCPIHDRASCPWGRAGWQWHLAHWGFCRW